MKISKNRSPAFNFEKEASVIGSAPSLRPFGSCLCVAGPGGKGNATYDSFSLFPSTAPASGSGRDGPIGGLRVYFYFFVVFFLFFSLGFTFIGKKKSGEDALFTK